MSKRISRERGNSTVQSVVFQKRFWTVKRSRKWLKDHDFKSTGKVDRNKTQLRFRQQPPRNFLRFTTKKIQPSVQLILGFKK